MAAKNQLFQVDDIIVDGVAIAFESGTAELEGIAGYEHEVVPSATGDDFTKYKRVGRTLKAKIQFGPTTTPEMFAELRMDLAERKGVAQHTEVVRLDAEVLEVVEEASRYIASVHFHGLIREDRQDVAEFSEVWHLIKHVQDNTWIIAGIQQTQ